MGDNMSKGPNVHWANPADGKTKNLPTWKSHMVLGLRGTTGEALNGSPTYRGQSTMVCVETNVVKPALQGSNLNGLLAPRECRRMDCLKSTEIGLRGVIASLTELHRC